MEGHEEQTKTRKTVKVEEEETKLKRKTLKWENIKQEQALVHSERRLYESGAFHENSSRQYL